MIPASEQLSIRRALPEDAGLISVLATVSFYEAYFEQDDPHDLTNYIRGSFELDRVAEELGEPGSSFLIAFLDGKAVGYARLIEGSRHPSITTPATTELRRIYVVERVWGTGVGQLLLDRCFDEARELGAGSIWLGVWERNARAQRFYEKNGFAQRGTLEFPYGDSVGINLVLEKTLQNLML